MFSGEQAREDAAQAEDQIRTAAFMGLRIMTDQAFHLAKQGSMIPHLYPERELSVLSEAPTPLGMAGHDGHPLARFASDFVGLEMSEALTAQLCVMGHLDQGVHDLLGLPAMLPDAAFRRHGFPKNSLHAA